MVLLASLGNFQKLSVDFFSNIEIVCFTFSFAVMYLILPETEGRSLQDIELHYSDGNKRLTDIEIKRSIYEEKKFGENRSTK